jgi:tetratricopeptide (TPR) repeat protein
MQNDIEKIEKYIDGELGNEDLFNFKNLLSNDPDIKRNYNLVLEINKSILEEDIMALRETLDNIYKNNLIVKRTSSVFTRTSYLYSVAASIALLIATGIFVQRFNNLNTNNQVIYEKYYSPYEVSVAYRSGNTEIDRLLFNAFDRYEKKDYEQALGLFEEVLQSREEDMAANLYSGITYMEEEKYQKAKTSFNKIILNNDNMFIEQAKWYLALCYLKTEKNDDAQVILSEIIKEESYYKEMAVWVLKDLKK